jgi:hypothetical protein
VYTTGINCKYSIDAIANRTNCDYETTHELSLLVPKVQGDTIYFTVKG